MDKHTPGPWFVPEGGVKPCVVAEGGWKVIAILDDCGDEMEANARLIAAAPDLLAAAKAMRDILPGAWDCDETPGGNAAWEALIAAIAKAEGRE